MDNSLVIKLKYGDFLRRFNAHVDENNQLDLDMIRLRAKILSLFNIPADANFILRYVDEDGDLVTLLDDDDLCDVMRQSLKFLRIYVHMSNDSVGKSNARSSGSATLLRSPTVPSGNVADAVKFVSCPLLKTNPNLSNDFVSKSASSSSVVATLPSKMEPSILNFDCQPQVAAFGSSKSGVTEQSVPDQGIVPQSKYVELNSSFFAECPFSGTYLTDSAATSFGNHCKRSCNHTEAIGGVFHKGINCDYCGGVYPITGPHCKSKVKENYDLCSFLKSHPLRTGAILNHARPELDSLFILDVNKIDGTTMAPSTAFSKIWRMKNIGISVWPKGTQLVWIGGNMPVDSQSFYLEIPEDGVPVDKVLDIAVVLRAPQVPGRYFSYWTMAYPSYQYFGQIISVFIQVEAPPKDSFYDSCQGLNLIIPPYDSGYKGSQIPDINVKPIIDEDFLQPHNSTSPTEPVKQKVDEQLKLRLENYFTIKSTFDGHSTSSSATSMAPFSVTEETLLEELDEMGFKQVDADKEMLNEYNLEHSVDDLCSSIGWDLLYEKVQGR